MLEEKLSFDMRRWDFTGIVVESCCLARELFFARRSCSGAKGVRNREKRAHAHRNCIGELLFCEELFFREGVVRALKVCETAKKECSPTGTALEHCSFRG